MDEQKEIRVIFFDITKAFDRVWHEGLLSKLQKAGVSGPLLLWFRNYLCNREQRVVINGQNSSWGKVEAGIPQGSILGPLLFLIYINDIVDVVHSNIRLFADDVTLFMEVDQPDTAARNIDVDLSNIQNWADKWLVTFNPTKTKTMLISRRLISRNYPNPVFCNSTVESVNEHKHLGLIIRSDLTWSSHVNSITEKGTKLVNIMKSVQHRLQRSTLETVCMSFIRPILEYGDVVWAKCSHTEES